MALSQIFSCGWSASGGPAVSSSPTITGDTAIMLSFTLAGSTTNQEQQFGFDAAAMKGVLITDVDNNGTVTLKTNSTGSPDHTKNWSTGRGETFWSSRSSETNPFGTTDVTTTYWTNAGSATATVTVRLLMNT